MATRQSRHRQCTKENNIDDTQQHRSRESAQYLYVLSSGCRLKIGGFKVDCRYSSAQCCYRYQTPQIGRDARGTEIGESQRGKRRMRTSPGAGGRTTSCRATHRMSTPTHPGPAEMRDDNNNGIRPGVNQNRCFTVKA